MEAQRSFAAAEFEAKQKTTRREKFLTRMEAAVPWAELLAVIEPFCPRGRRGRPPRGRARRRRVYFLQRWDGRADAALEDARHDRQALRGFARTDLAARGLLLRAGTLVGATLIAAPSSTKNREQQRDPERHQSKQGHPWRFGRKARLGADRDRGLVHTVVAPAANVADITRTAELLHGQEKQMHADAGYVGVEKRAEIRAKDPAGRIGWQIARPRGPVKALAAGAEKELIKAAAQAKARVRVAPPRAHRHLESPCSCPCRHRA